MVGLEQGNRACIVSVNVIVVVGHEKLNVEMQRAYGSILTVVKIPKSGGVCGRVSGLNQLIILYRSSSWTLPIANASQATRYIVTCMVS